MQDKYISLAAISSGFPKAMFTIADTCTCTWSARITTEIFALTLFHISATRVNGWIDQRRSNTYKGTKPI